MTKREQTKKLMVGNVAVGGDAAVTVQSMCNTKTWDVDATIAQIMDFHAAGCDIVRVAVPDMRAAEAISALKERSPIPIVCDIHFDYRLALECADCLSQGRNGGKRFPTLVGRILYTQFRF